MNTDETPLVLLPLGTRRWAMTVAVLCAALGVLLALHGVGVV